MRFIDAEKIGEDAMRIGLTALALAEREDPATAVAALCNVVEALADQSPALRYAVIRQLRRSADRLEKE